MAEDNNEGLVIVEELIRDGHKVFYSLRLNPHGFEGAFHQLEHETSCPMTPTSWLVELRCERVTRDSYYDFTSRLSRLDHSNEVVKITYIVSFLDADRVSVVPALSNSRDRFRAGDVLENLVPNIHPAFIRAVVFVKVTYEIERCHADANWQLASKLITYKNHINQKSKL